MEVSWATWQKYPVSVSLHMNKTYISIRAPLGVDQNTGVTPMVCTREFLTGRSCRPSPDNVHLLNADSKSVIAPTVSLFLEPLTEANRV
jgi:hypothetical protein